ncbi:hypothetical protein O3P69_002404 [Scylla paramamosain]|uniref:Ionotropic glutamate receptor L-glutamate and glycine-binding domain-containing protein n=1 Tax=Scylla paramamosain TaxID=85552 RepID=A0AAW0V6J2_SCYPA
MRWRWRRRWSNGGPHLKWVEKNVDGNGEGQEGSITIEGAMANFFQILAISMNFTYRLVRPKDNTFGSLNEDGTWNGMVGLVNRGEVDLGLGPFAITEPRWLAVGYSQPVAHTDLRIVTSVGSIDIDPWAFLLPLSPALWGMLMATLVVVWLATLLVGRLGQAWRQWPHSVFLQLYGALMQQGEGAGLAALVHESAGWWVEEVTKHTLAHTFPAAGVTMPLCGQRLRLVVGGWIVASALVVWSYSGLLVSVMTVRQVPRPIQTADDLLEASHVKVIMRGNTAYTQILEQAESGVLHDLYGLRALGRLDWERAGTPEWFRLMGLGDYASIVTTLSGVSLKARDFSSRGRCLLYIAKESLVSFSYSIIAPKNNTIMPAIDARVRAVVESGLYDYWLQQGIPNATVCDSSPSTVTVHQPFSLASLWYIEWYKFNEGTRLALAAVWVRVYLGRGQGSLVEGVRCPTTQYTYSDPWVPRLMPPLAPQAVFAVFGIGLASGLLVFLLEVTICRSASPSAAFPLVFSSRSVKPRDREGGEQKKREEEPAHTREPQLSCFLGQYGTLRRGSHQQHIIISSAGKLLSPRHALHHRDDKAAAAAAGTRYKIEFTRVGGRPVKCGSTFGGAERAEVQINTGSVLTLTGTVSGSEGVSASSVRDAARPDAATQGASDSTAAANRGTARQHRRRSFHK